VKTLQAGPCSEIFAMTEAGAAVANATGNKIVMGLADRPGADMKARLLLALTALYVERPTHTVEEEQQYVELVLRLIDKVDATAQAQVAGMLNGHAAAPAEILARLGAAPMAPGIGPDGALQATIADLPAEPASAERAVVTPALALSTRTASPAEADLPSASAAARLAELGEAFFAGNAGERRQLLSRIAALDAADDNEFGPQPAAPDHPERHFANLDAAAMEGRIGEFLREFERLLSIPKSLCERILNDRSGEPMVIAAKAANMPIAVLQRILLLVNPAVSHSVQRVYDLTDLFHDIEQGTAVKLLSVWRARACDVEAAATSEPSESKSLRPLDALGLRSRFGALAERVRVEDGSGKGVSARSVPGSAARRDLRSR
jgi:hypothetical protein